MFATMRCTNDCVYLLYLLTVVTGNIRQSCKEIAENDASAVSGEYSIKTVSGRILKKVSLTELFSTTDNGVGEILERWGV